MPFPAPSGLLRTVGVAAACLLHFSGCGASSRGLAAEPQPQASLAVPAPTPSYPLHRHLRGGGTPEPLVGTLVRELYKIKAELAQQKPAPYYLSLQVIETETQVLEASGGALLTQASSGAKHLQVDVRLGGPELDNTHPISGQEAEPPFARQYALPLEASPDALVRELRRAVDAEFDIARVAYAQAQAEQQVESQANKGLADFTRERAEQYYESRIRESLDVSTWTQRLVDLSKVAASYPSVLESEVELRKETELRTFVDTEGAQQQLASQRVRLDLAASTIAADGMLLERGHGIDVLSVQNLPNSNRSRQAFSRVLRETQALAKAPVIEPYVGPALLEGRAAGVFFHEVLGHRVEGHRQHAGHEGQTFTDMLGQQILLADLDVYDDPTLTRVGDIPLSGHYAFDDEGVRARRAELVVGGVFAGFVLSRDPVRGFAHSNGHGRREPGYRALSRQANLVIHPRRALSRSRLNLALQEAVRQQGLEFGLRFEEIVGGYTQTERGDAQAFKVMPVMVYKVFPDGREQLVRGVDIEGTPLTALSKISHVGTELEVFNGVCGAESGWVPVSAVSPPLLVSQIEVARKEKGQLRPPLLPPPDGQAVEATGGGN